MACPFHHSSDHEKTKAPETTRVSHAPHEGWHVTWGRFRVRVGFRVRVSGQGQGRFLRLGCGELG